MTGTERKRAAQKRWRDKNVERRKEYNAAWRAAHREEQKAYAAAYYHRQTSTPIGRMLRATKRRLRYYRNQWGIEVPVK